MASSKKPPATEKTLGSAVAAIATSVDPLLNLRADEFREPIQELEGLLSQPRRAFLLGAGCSVCAGLPMMDQLTTDVQLAMSGSSKDILDGIRATYNGSDRVTIEDFMSELVDHISLADRRALRAAKETSVLLNGNKYDHETLRTALHNVKRGIADAIEKKDTAKHIETHRAFIRAVHGTLKSGKTATTHKAVDYFTLNYDTLLEDALALERIPLADGFVGGATAWWNPQEFGEANVDARLFKLHGSIDWSLCAGDGFPRRIRDGLAVTERREQILIWPAATKYREAQSDPYAQLIAYFRHSLRPVELSQTVLCICGYAFADEHINVEIEHALREADDKLTVVILTSDAEPSGRVKTWLDDKSIRERIRVYADRGFFHGDTVRKSDRSLPWWKFEVLTMLLGGS